MAKARLAVIAAVQPNAILEIGGEKFTLVYDFNAIADAEALTGCNLLHGMAATLINTMSAAQLRGLLYASLQTNHPYRPAANGKPESGISLRKAGQMCTLKEAPVIAEKIREAWALSLPEADKNPPKAGSPPASN